MMPPDWTMKKSPVWGICDFYKLHIEYSFASCYTLIIEKVILERHDTYEGFA